MVPMYIDVVPNRNSRPAILLRESRREGKKVRKRTLANITHWPGEQVEALRRVLNGEKLVPASETFVVQRSLPHGHVEALLFMLRKLGLDQVIASKRCRQRDLIVALIVERLIQPRSKLASTRHWLDTTLAEELSVADADVDEAYAALDWLRARQKRIERKLAGRHLGENARVLYDVSSSFYEGRTCPLAQFGHDRDGRKGLPIIVYGLMTDDRGCPVALEVFPGNTGDPTTLAAQIEKLRKQFGLTHVILVGDRGMLTEARIEALRNHTGIGWISALRSSAIRELVEEGHLQPSLFDKRNLAEIRSPEFPGERLMACFNPQLADKRRRKRDDLLEATERELTRIAAEVARRTRTPLTADEIGVKVGRVVNRFKVGKHFRWTIEDGCFEWRPCDESIELEGRLDGIYVVRTSEPVERLSAAETVRSYKGLSQVEQAFRCLKGLDVRVRPIFHRTADHVRAHIFLCMLAYYVEWHLQQAWKELLFHDEELNENRRSRDPVAAAEPSESAQTKKARRRRRCLTTHNFETLLGHLATRCRQTCRLGCEPSGESCTVVTEPTPLQARAMKLLELYPVAGRQT